MIVSIYLSPASGEALHAASSALVTKGAGIVGDRNFRKNEYPGQNVTFIATEAVTRYNQDHGQSIGPQATRRNIITAGVDLNSLVGKDFSIGSATFRGVELCTPCDSLGKLLENEHISSPDVVKAFLSSSGLRADVLASGEISIGMSFSVSEHVPSE